MFQEMTELIFYQIALHAALHMNEIYIGFDPRLGEGKTIIGY